jgi:DegV family protein with EDD domain
MSKVAVVTDSTSTIPKEFLDQYPLWVAPQVLIWGSETLLDGIDIQPDEFYSRLVKDPLHPTTSQVTPVSFQKLFKELIEQEYEILAVLVSPKLSGTMESAIQAKELFPGMAIELVNSESVAMGLGFHAIMAARAAKDGASLEECKQIALKAVGHTGLVLTVETLEYLHRGGRIGGGAKFLGTALNIKPILEVRGGRIEAVERIRTRGKSLMRVVELVEQQVAGRTPVRLAALHANSPVDAQTMLEAASASLNPVETIVSVLSPVVGTHAGPGTVGIAYMAGM